MTEFDTWKASEAADYLSRVRNALFDLRRIQDEIEVQRSLIPTMDYTRDRVKSSLTTDSLEQAVIRIFDCIELYVTELAAYEEMRYEAHEAISQLEDGRYRAILTLYYLNGHSWETVGEKAKYNAQYCKDLRAEALPLFWDVMPKHEKTRIPRAD